MLALGRRPLHQERARPDPPTAGDRPRDRDVGAGARRPCARPRGAHPYRDPADDDALHPRRTQQARGARDAGRARPPVAVLKRIEGTDKLRLERERAAAKEAAKAAPGAGQAPVRKGLSPEAVAAIREVVEGRPRPPGRAVTSAPVDPWNPAESHLIPLNPGESRPENVSEASRPGPAAPGGLGQSHDVPPCSRHVMAGPARIGSGYPAIHRAAHPSRGMTEGDARNKSGHDEVGGPVGWIASPSMQTATAHSPSPPLRDKKWLAERAGVRPGH